MFNYMIKEEGVKELLMCAVIKYFIYIYKEIGKFYLENLKQN